MPVAEAREISPARKGAAALAMFASGGTLALDALRHLGPDWIIIAFAGVLAAAGVALTRTSLIAQVLGRGAAWLTLVPAAIATGAEISYGRVPGLTEAALAVGTASALALARPLLHTKEARAEFHPHRFRKILLAGSTATAATAFMTGGFALEMFSFGASYAGAAAFAALTVALLATAIGVVRMRGWGILLGVATSAVLGVAAALMAHHGGGVMALFALPMLVLHTLPILIARYGTSPTASAEPVRYRIAEPMLRVDDADDDFVEADAELAPVRAFTCAERP